jgi:glyoxalase family protein
MANDLIRGLHHVTAMSSSPQANVDFYAGILGLRLVKKTVNFDAPDVYHLYYGDESGNPGSIMTFFPFGSNAQLGRAGYGQAAITAFSIPEKSIGYWLKRFEHFKINHRPPQERFNESVIYFEDYDGLKLALVANDRDNRKAFSYGHIPLEHSILGFYGVELWEQNYYATEALLAGQLNHQFIQESGPRRRYASSKDAMPGQIVDVLWNTEKATGLSGAGTVHHIAFDTPTDEDQLTIREKVSKAGFHPTPVIDRQYFHSIYFREPGGVLFEVATTPPGFSADESLAELGTSLKLPQWHENRRSWIESLLEPITLNTEKYVSPNN